MATKQANTIKRLRFFILAIVSVVAVMLLASCSQKKIVEKEVLNVPEVLYVDAFDPEMNNIKAAVNACDIKAHVKYDDGTEEDVALTFDMLEDSFKKQLNSEGRHYISYTYKGEKLEFEVLVQLAKTFAVRFYDNNNNLISEQRVKLGEAATEPSEAERAVEGYTFMKWDKSFNKIVRDLDIHGIYEQKSYTVRFYDNNKNLISEQTVKHGEAAIEPSETERAVEGYTFIGWDNAFDNVTDELNIHGIYDVITYTVRFYNNNNDLISEQTVKHGEAAIEPSETERAVEGYIFVSWDAEFNNVTSDLVICGIYEEGFVVTFYNCKNVLIDTQYIQKNGDAVAPSDAAVYVPGYTFLRWDAELTNIQNDTEIYGVYINDTTTDTDGDGIIDYIEVEILNLDYTKADTDGDGVTDDKEDTDGDGLSNLNEIKSFLKPNDPDTDGDGLTDGDEVEVYWTLPADPDTDGDGANDGWEITNSFDPLDYNETFEVKTTVSMPDNTEISVDIPELPGEFVDKPIVEPSTNESIQNLHGSIGDPIQYNVSASASIKFSSEEIAAAEDPVLMYFNTETNEVEAITVSVSGSEATASVTKYGSYALVDRKVFEEKGQWRDVFESGSYSSIEIVFVIDDSGSMGPVGANNDPQNKRLSVSIDLINSLPAGAKIGIVRFDDYATALTSTLTTSKDVAKSYLTTTHFTSVGSTLLYSGAMTGLGLYSEKQDDDGVLRIMILLSDGYPSSDYYTQSNVINSANAKDVKIYTVGLGTSTSAFNSTLVPIANATNAQYTHSANAAALKAIYDQIGEKIDMEVDSDNDGLADFFESGVDKNGVPTLPTINGNSFEGLDKTNPDTDGDGYMDGVEIEIYKYYSEAKPGQVMVWGIVNSDPTDAASVPKAE